MYMKSNEEAEMEKLNKHELVSEKETKSKCLESCPQTRFKRGIPGSAEKFKVVYKKKKN